MFSHEGIQRFHDIEGQLAAVVEKHLPGDFDSWEAENSTWDGEIKTVRNTDKDPRTPACVWGIFLAADMPDEILMYIPPETNSDALSELEEGLQQAAAALSKLSGFIMIELDRAASKRLRASYAPPPEKSTSALVTLRLVEQAIPFGVEAARVRLKEISDPTSRANRQAAAVVKACQKVYESRTGRAAPKTSRDDPQKSAMNPKPSPFVSFVRDVFALLGVGGRVDSAQRLLKELSN